MKISDIKMLTSESGLYRCDVGLKRLKGVVQDYLDNYGLDILPDFQRGHVWTKTQQTNYMEFLISGGRPTEIKFNDPSIDGSCSDFFVIVDGLQRLTTLLLFMDNKVKVYGVYKDDIEDIDKLLGRIHIPFVINDLKTKKEVLKWYVEMNSGGTPHTEEEIKRVKDMIKNIS